MTRSRFFSLSAFRCQIQLAALAVAFLAGLLTGAPASAGARASFDGARDALAWTVGISALIPPLLPLLVSAFAVYIRSPVLLIPTAFWKAFCFSYTGAGIARSWGQAGGLVGGLALFGSLCTLPVLWWYWLRHIGGEDFSGRTFCPALAAAALIGWMDLWVISPFLSSILTF